MLEQTCDGHLFIYLPFFYDCYQAFKVIQNGVKPPGVLKTLLDVVSHVKTTSNNSQNCKSIVSDDGLSLV